MTSKFAKCKAIITCEVVLLLSLVLETGKPALNIYVNFPLNVSILTDVYVYNHFKNNSLL